MALRIHFFKKPKRWPWDSSAAKHKRLSVYGSFWDITQHKVPVTFYLTRRCNEVMVTFFYRSSDVLVHCQCAPDNRSLASYYLDVCSITHSSFHSRSLQKALISKDNLKERDRRRHERFCLVEIVCKITEFPSGSKSKRVQKLMQRRSRHS